MTRPIRKDVPPIEAARVQAATNAAVVFARKGAAWSEVTPLGDLRFRLRLGGLFRTAWMARLCSSLADRGISIDQAHARLSHDGSWIAELTLLALPGAADPAAVPCLELAEADELMEPAALELERFALRASSDHGATLLLALEAQDTLGLLGSLLALLAKQGLVPVETHIETRAGRAHDSLWLTMLDGSGPSPSTQAALDELLAQALRA